MTIAWSLVI